MCVEDGAVECMSISGIYQCIYSVGVVCEANAERWQRHQRIGGWRYGSQQVQRGEVYALRAEPIL